MNASTTAPRARLIRLAAAATAAVLAIGACGGDDDAGSATTAEAATTTTAEGGTATTDAGTDATTTTTGGGPAVGDSVLDCGIEVPVGDPPEHVFAVYHNAIEMAHAIGISDRLVGTAFLDNPVLPEYADAQAAATYYESIPSREEMLASGADFVISGFTGAFTERGLGTRAELAGIGIGSWLFRALCPTQDGGPQTELAVDDVPLELIYGEVTDLAAVFGEQERAAELVANMQQRIAAVEATLEGTDERPTVAVINLPEGGQFRVFGGGDMMETIIEHAGGEQIFPDVPGRMARVGVEEVIVRNPDVILIPACCGDDVGPEASQDDIDTLLADPTFANVTAVREGRVYGVTFAETSPGVRAAYAIENVARLLHPELFAD